MQSLRGKIRFVFGRAIDNLDNSYLRKIYDMDSRILGSSELSPFNSKLYPSLPFISCKNPGARKTWESYSASNGPTSIVPSCRGLMADLNQSTSIIFALPVRSMSTAATALEDASKTCDLSQRIKFKRMDKTARHIMQILDKEDVEGVRASREIADIRPGYIIQLKVEVPENRRRVSVIKGIVIARQNAGLNTTFRIRRLVAGVGIESLFHLYSPNIKEIKVLDKKKVRRAKLYYLRDKMNALRKQ